MYCISEKRSNWEKTLHDCQLKNIFDLEMKLRAVTDYNDHENTSWAQEGGTRAMVFDELTTMVESMDVAETKLVG